MLSVKIIVLQQVHLILKKMTPTQQGPKGPILTIMAKIKMKDESPHRGALLAAFCTGRKKWHEGREVYQYS